MKNKSALEKIKGSFGINMGKAIVKGYFWKKVTHEDDSGPIAVVGADRGNFLH
jgi:hypothetical protein